LIEAANKRMGGDTQRSIGHLNNYILPYLSAEQRSQVLRNLSDSGHERYARFDPSADGSHYDPENTTHNIVSRHKNPVTGEVYEPGTKVKVTGVRTDTNGKIHIQTRDHGEMPLSKLGTPAELAKVNLSQKTAFEQERRLQQNYDPSIATAGASDQSHDATVVPEIFKKSPEQGAAVTKIIKSIEDKSENAPTEAGTEIKTTTGKNGTATAGQSPLIFDYNTKQWRFGNKKMAEVFAAAKHKDGRSILDYLNQEHSNGIIPKGFSIDADKETMQKYLDSINATAFHLHKIVKNKSGDVVRDTGTTFEVAKNIYKGKTGLPILTEDQIKTLNGQIRIPATFNGKTTAKHFMSRTGFEELHSLHEKNPEMFPNHVNSQDHAAEYVKRINQAANEIVAKKQQEANKPARSLGINTSNLKPQPTASSATEPEAAPVVPQKRTTPIVGGKQW